MDKTFNNLMDIVHRTKKIDEKTGTPRRLRTSKTDTVPSDEAIEVVVEKKVPSSSAFKESSAISNFLTKSKEPKPKKVTVEKEVEEKKTTSKKSTSKSTTKSAAKKATKGTASKSTAKGAAKSTTKGTSKSTTKATAKDTKKTPSKATTKKASTTKVGAKAKAIKDADKGNEKVKSLVEKMKKEKIKKEPKIDLDDPKNKQMYEALKSTLFADGTDISDYLEEEKAVEKVEVVENRVEEPTMTTEEMNREITEEQQAYEQLFTGSLASGNEIVTGDEENTEDDEYAKYWQNKNAENSVNANDNESVAENIEPEKVEAEESNENDITTINSRNALSEEKIAEYYRRKQEKIAEEEKQKEEETYTPKVDEYTSRKNEYEDIFSGEMTTRSELMGEEQEEESAQEEIVETPEVVENEIDTEDTNDDEYARYWAGKDINDQEVIDDIESIKSELMVAETKEDETAEVEEKIDSEEDATESEENIDEVVDETTDENEELSEEETEEDDDWDTEEDDDYTEYDDEELDRYTPFEEDEEDEDDVEEYIVSSNIDEEPSPSLVEEENEFALEETTEIEEEDIQDESTETSESEESEEVVENEEETSGSSEEEVEEKVEEEEKDNLSKTEFYSEIAKLQENLINELKSVKPEQEEKFTQPVVNVTINEKSVVEKVENTKKDDSRVEVLVDEIVEDLKAKGIDEEEQNEEVVEGLLNVSQALNEEDLEYQEKSEEPKEIEKDSCFYLSPEDNEKKAIIQDEYLNLYNEQEYKEKEVGDINLNKDIKNAIPSSKVIAEPEVVVHKDEDTELQAIYTLMGVEKKKMEKKKEDLKVLYVAGECQPFVATGGLADVAGALPKAVAKLGGVDIRVILPLYANIKSEYRDKFEYLGNFTVHLSWRQEYCGLFRYYSDGVTYYFIDNERYFKRDNTYGYYDDGERFAYFSKAIVECLPLINFFPDIIHCNDWQSALVSAYIKTGNWNDYRYYKIKHIYTIHNVEYQGVYGMENLRDLFGIDYRFTRDMEYNGDINLTKAAILYSDKFTTVSNSYCDNLKQPYCSRGLHHCIIRNEYKLSGIINGVDYEFYNPETDKALYKNYSLATMQDKVMNKKIWQDELGLPVDGTTPMISIVSRLVSHKGLDLITKIIEDLLQDDIQFVVVGTGDEKYVNYYRYLEEKYPTKVRALVNEYSNVNARKAYAASDIFLMPSKIEPCGISQMIACKYGAIPVVRETGGLKDTITDFGCVGGGNGYTFANYNPNDLSYVLKRAINDYKDKEEWQKKMRTCMSCDFSWEQSAKKYIELYKSLF